jgi:hypothetical protein
MSIATQVCKEQYNLEKEEFESIIVDLHGPDKTRTLTRSEWESVAKEIVGRMDNFFDELIQIVVLDYLDGGHTD